MLMEKLGFASKRDKEGLKSLVRDYSKHFSPRSDDEHLSRTLLMKNVVLKCLPVHRLLNMKIVVEPLRG